MKKYITIVLTAFSITFCAKNLHCAPEQNRHENILDLIKPKLSAQEEKFLNTLLEQIKKLLENDTKLIKNSLMAKDTANNVLNNIEKFYQTTTDTDAKKDVIRKKRNEALFKKCKEQIVKFANPFLKPLYKFKSILKPFVETILKNIDTLDKKSNSQNEYMLTLFFKANATEVDNLFNTLLVDIETIRETCEEFIILCEIVNNKLPEEKLNQAIKEIEVEKQKRLNAANKN